jgi:hypothetical protein
LTPPTPTTPTTLTTLTTSPHIPRALQRIISSYRLASRLAVAKVKELAISIGEGTLEQRKEMLEKCAQTSLNSKLVRVWVARGWGWGDGGGRRVSEWGMCAPGIRVGVGGDCLWRLFLCLPWSACLWALACRWGASSLLGCALVGAGL